MLVTFALFVGVIVLLIVCHGSFARLLIPENSPVLRALGSFAYYGGPGALAAWWLMRHQTSLGSWAHGRVLAAWGRYAYRAKVRAVVVQAIRDLGVPPDALRDRHLVAEENRNHVLADGVAEDSALDVLHVAHRFAL